MYYAEQIVNGVLCFRNTPDGEWYPVVSPYADAVHKLLALTDAERHRAMQFFCHGCGCIQPDHWSCNCWHDQ